MVSSLIYIFYIYLFLCVRYGAKYGKEKKHGECDVYLLKRRLSRNALFQETPQMQKSKTNKKKRWEKDDKNAPSIHCCTNLLKSCVSFAPVSFVSLLEYVCQPRVKICHERAFPLQIQTLQYSEVVVSGFILPAAENLLSGAPACLFWAHLSTWGCNLGIDATTGKQIFKLFLLNFHSFFRQ